MCAWGAQKIVHQGGVIVARMSEFAAVPVATRWTAASGASKTSRIRSVTCRDRTSAPYGMA
jgi:hypothetical protein